MWVLRPERRRLENRLFQGWNMGWASRNPQEIPFRIYPDGGELELLSEAAGFAGLQLSGAFIVRDLGAHLNISRAVKGRHTIRGSSTFCASLRVTKMPKGAL